MAFLGGKQGLPQKKRKENKETKKTKNIRRV